MMQVTCAAGVVRGVENEPSAMAQANPSPGTKPSPLLDATHTHMTGTGVTSADATSAGVPSTGVPSTGVASTDAPSADELSAAPAHGEHTLSDDHLSGDDRLLGSDHTQLGQELARDIAQHQQRRASTSTTQAQTHADAHADAHAAAHASDRGFAQSIPGDGFGPGEARYLRTATFFSIPHLEATPFGPSNLVTRFTDAPVDCTTPKARELGLTVTCPIDTLPKPHRPPADLPVVVFIHGGRYEEGHHDGSWYQGVRFAESGCVFVSLGYRTGLDGFATFRDDAPGFYRGIHDCLLGLEWVQKNIESFGGDPTNVTLVGQSAGAGIALWLSRKDHFRGAFRRVIAASPGFPRASFTSRVPWLRFFLSSPITRRHLRAMHEHKPRKLARGYRRFRNRFITDCALGPYPWDTQELVDIPIMLTHTHDEFYLEPLAAWADRRKLSAGLARLMARSVGVRGSVRRYVAASAAIDPDHVGGRLVGDSTIKRWVADVVEGLGGAHRDVWLAELTGSSTRPAVHCADLPLMFGCFDRHPERVELFLQGPVGETQYRVASVVHRAVVDFAHGRLPSWPRYGQHRVEAALNIDDGLVSRVTDPLAHVRVAFPLSDGA